MLFYLHASGYCFRKNQQRVLSSLIGVCAILLRLYISTERLKSLHKPRTTSGNILFHISYAFNCYLQLLCLQFLTKSRLHFKKFTFGIKIVLFLKLLLYQSMIAKIVHLQNKTFQYYLGGHYLLYTLVSRIIILDFRACRSMDP
jgi:hypothetical protein